MKIHRLSLVLTCMVVSVGKGSVIIDQSPDLYGGPTSDTDFYDVSGRRLWQREADNIVLAQEAEISHLKWYGFYGGDGTPVTPPPNPESFEIRILAARPGDGLPDEQSVLFDQSYLNPQRLPTGRVLIAVGGQPPEQMYDVDIGPPLHLIGGQIYWLEIVQLDDASTMFRWEDGDGLVDGHSFKNPLTGGWYGVTYESFSFQLSSVPEPWGFGVLLLLCWPLFVSRRHFGIVRTSAHRN